MLTLELAVAGIGIGAVAALSGLGLLVTYRATGVFNLAFGAIAMICAYLLWQTVQQWGWPIGVAAPLVLLVFAPALGLVLERLVFRPLERRAAPPSESLVASLGVFVLLVGCAFVVWGSETHVDVPTIVPAGTVQLGDISIRYDTIVDLAVVAVVSIALAVVVRTRAGLVARAVVERRSLAELTGLPADRVALAGWAIGSTLAGTAGVLIAPRLRLDPYGLTLVVLETMAVAVIARLISPVVAVVSALVLGVAQSELTRFHLAGRNGALLDALTTNLFVVALLVAVLLLPRLDEPGGADAGATAHLAVRRELRPPRGWWIPCVVLLAIPLAFQMGDLRDAQQVPALAVILVSIVVVTGYTGQISLGQAGFAGLGALLAAKLAAGRLWFLPQLPDVLAVFVGALLVVPVGLLTGWPAIRRRGLFLALTTFAVGSVVSRFVFTQSSFVSSVRVSLPTPFTGDRAFYVFELLCLGGALLLVSNLHSGRLGRALLAIRDDEDGARAAGVDVRRLKVFVFAVSAGLAGLGGVLLSQSLRAFDAATFDPIQSLIWFAAVVVFGVDSAAGAVIAAAAIIGLDAGVTPGASTIAIGAAALLLGRMPGGLLYTLRRAGAYVSERADEPPPLPPARLSPAGRAVLEKLPR
jgi:branched-subunit amino acid ABC-type transport system permease component